VEGENRAARGYLTDSEDGRAGCVQRDTRIAEPPYLAHEERLRPEPEESQDQRRDAIEEQQRDARTVATRSKRIRVT
jgi:hypothetical protein